MALRITQLAFDRLISDVETRVLQGFVYIPSRLFTLSRFLSC